MFCLEHKSMQQGTLSITDSVCLICPVCTRLLFFLINILLVKEKESVEGKGLCVKGHFYSSQGFVVQFFYFIFFEKKTRMGVVGKVIS